MQCSQKLSSETTMKLSIDLIDTGTQTFSARQFEPQTARASASQPLRAKDRPHTVTALCVSLAIIWIASCFDWKVGNLSDSRKGCLAAVLFFLVFATVQFPDGILVRPHPAVWRLVKGVSVLYLCLIVSLLFQDVESVRAGLKQLDSSLGIPLIEKDYALDCRLLVWDHPVSIFSNIKAISVPLQSKLDIFVLAHLGGWLAKALVIRDTRLLWVMSLLFEAMEITFRHILPNFWECWWDHLILDVFGCNWLGIYLGMRLVKWLEMKDYKWLRSDPHHNHPPMTDASMMITMQPKTTSATGQRWTSRFEFMMPSQWTIYKWPPLLSSYQAYLGLLFSVFGVTFLDLNAFFLKAQLWIEPTHWILLVRSFFFLFASAAATPDMYEFVTTPHNRRLGVQAWLGVAIVLSELMLAIKYWHVLPHENPMPKYLKIIWSVFFVIAPSIGLALYFTAPRTSDSEHTISSSHPWTKMAPNTPIISRRPIHSLAVDDFKLDSSPSEVESTRVKAVNDSLLSTSMTTKKKKK